MPKILNREWNILLSPDCGGQDQVGSYEQEFQSSNLNRAIHSLIALILDESHRALPLFAPLN